jgi:hypothetical protein
MENSEVTATASEQFKEKSQAELAKELDAQIPKKVVSQRDGGGKKLSYLETYYVIDRMNKVFGHLNWSNETLELRQLPGDGKPSYIARVRVAVSLANGRIVFKDGVGYGSDKSGLNPHEMAAKEAESDAFKRAAKNFGISMGLGLYEKTGEFVDDEEPRAPAKVRAVALAPAPESAGSSSVSGNTIAPPPVAAQNGSSAIPESPPSDRKQLEEMISQMSRVAIAKKATTLSAIKKHLDDTYGTTEKEKLTEEQAKAVYAYLRGMILKEG